MYISNSLSQTAPSQSNRRRFNVMRWIDVDSMFIQRCAQWLYLLTPTIVKGTGKVTLKSLNIVLFEGDTIPFQRVI